MTPSPRRDHSDGEESAGMRTGGFRSPFSEPNDDELGDDNGSGEDYDDRDDDDDEYDDDDDDGDPDDGMEDTATREGDREGSDDNDTIDFSWEMLLEWVSTKGFWREFMSNVLVPLLKGLAWNAGVILSSKLLASYILPDIMSPIPKTAGDPAAAAVPSKMPQAGQAPSGGGGGGAAVAAAATATSRAVMSAVSATTTTAPLLKVTHMYYPHFASTMRQSQRYSM